MPFWWPEPDDTITIRGDDYNFLPRPDDDEMAWYESGGRGKVYRLAKSGSGGYYGLKTFWDMYRLDEIAISAKALEPYHHLPGMEICERTVLTPNEDASLIRQAEDLEYAVLMPWIEGVKWVNIVEKKKPLEAEECLFIADDVVNILATLEANGAAHCDMGNTNFLLDIEQRRTTLIDLEEMHMPTVQRPGGENGKRGFGTDGYRHPTDYDNAWGPFGDRFPGAILLAEILGWEDPDVCALAWGESYFKQEELQDPNNERYLLLKQSLRLWSPTVESLFETAWRSKQLSDCPSMQDWHLAIRAILGGVDPLNYDSIGVVVEEVEGEIEWEEVPAPIRKPPPTQTATVVEWEEVPVPAARANPAKKSLSQKAATKPNSSSKKANRAKVSNKAQRSRPNKKRVGKYETEWTEVWDWSGEILLDGFYSEANTPSDLFWDLKKAGCKLPIGGIISLRLASRSEPTFFHIHGENSLEELSELRKVGLQAVSKTYHNRIL